MADVTPTALSLAGSAGTYKTITAGEAVTVGHAVYMKAASATYFHAHCETSLITSTALGLVGLGNIAEDGQGVMIQSGLCNVTLSSGTLTADTHYYLSVTGLWMPYADKATSDWLTLIGIARTTTQIDVNIKVWGYQAA